MWTSENCQRYDHSSLRDPGDLTDNEWARVSPLIPPARRGGGKPAVDMRAVVNGLMEIVSTGCQWRAATKEFSARSMIYGYFDLWTYDGTINRFYHALYALSRELDGREASPTAAVIDIQSVKSAEKRGASVDPVGFDAGKKIKGRKRRILAETAELLLHATVHPADMRDRDGGVLVLKTLVGKFTLFKNRFTDGGYQGRKFRDVPKEALPSVETEIIKRSEAAQGFKVLARRWLVERTCALLGRCRRLAKDWECVNRKALVFLHPASIRLMLGKLCNCT